MKAFIKREVCIGCGLCAEICPEVFAMGDDMIAIVIVDESPASAQESVQDAATACPVEAIVLD
jgi:ferredoxin